MCHHSAKRPSVPLQTVNNTSHLSPSQPIRYISNVVL